MDRYIKDQDQSFDPKKTIRMSIIDGFEHKRQLVIPPGLTNAKGGGLGIQAHCFPDINDLPTQAEVQYKWPNIKGSEYFASYFGLAVIVYCLLEIRKVDLDYKNLIRKRPLSWAMLLRYEAIVKLLLDTGRMTL